jgi:hypothetical protein
MNSNIIPVKTVTLETLKEILTSAYYSTQPYESEDGNESNMIIVEMSHANIFMSLNSNLNMITFSTFFFPDEQSIEKLFWHVNYLNSAYKITKFYIEEFNDGTYVINVNFMMNIKSGLDAFTMVDNLRLFHDIVGLAMAENVGTALEDGIAE